MQLSKCGTLATAVTASGYCKLWHARELVQKLQNRAGQPSVVLFHCVCHAHSSGNHAAALALAAQLRGIPAYIVVPNNAPACKLAAVKEYGGGWDGSSSCCCRLDCS